MFNISQYYIDNNYVVSSTIYKLRPIQFMGAIEQWRSQEVEVGGQNRKVPSSPLPSPS